MKQRQSRETNLISTLSTDTPSPLNRLNMIFLFIDVDECLTSKPCLNGATCVNEPGSYNCTCQQGHTGKNCEKGK